MPTPADPAGACPRLSIVMPVLNEAATIGATLARLQPLRDQGAELIVVDGGSHDDTAQRAAAAADRVLHAPRGRAHQMNAGARLARGEILLFLHADTLLPDDAPAALSAAIDAGARWGRFDVRIDGRARMLAVIATLMNLRSRWSGIATGDQAIFVTRREFEAVGGYPPLALMEDLALSDALRRRSPPACLRTRVLTAGRRWARYGVWRTILRMWVLRAAYRLGVSPTRLARHYPN